MSQWSIQVRIEEETQEVSIEFTPQHLQPQQYGVVVSSIILHLANCFAETNPAADRAFIVGAILDGVKIGLQTPNLISEPILKH